MVSPSKPDCETVLPAAQCVTLRVQARQSQFFDRLGVQAIVVRADAGLVHEKLSAEQETLPKVFV